MQLSKSDPHPRPRVLVVDDNQALADLSALVLNESGFSARAVYSGLCALSVFRKTRPEVVISDIEMPGLDGVQTAMAIKGLDPLCGIILVSGAVQDRIEDFLVDAQAEGLAFEFMLKPVYPGELILRIRDLVAKRNAGARGLFC